MSDVSVLTKRRLQAEVVGPIFEAMVAEVGRERAEAILDAAIRKAAVTEGAMLRERVPEGGNPMRAFIDVFELWTRGGALEIEVLEASDERFDFNVTRCRYAETYRAMGVGDIGHLLSCNRDGTFVEGFDSRLRLDRAQTIMAGAPSCTFRYRLASPE
jgi:hypothetical protein